MKVVRAAAMGMCFGVKDALETIRSLNEPGSVTIYGELVHNPKVLEEIAARGIAQLSETNRNGVPASPSVLVTAHGISNTRRNAFTQAGRQIIDTTCPLVRRVHDAAQLYHNQGWFVVVIGKRKHVEVQGIIEDLAHYAVVESPGQAQPYDAVRIAVIAQTTTSPAEAESILTAVTAANPASQIRWIDTICRPTRDRQEAADELLRIVEALIVVGGRNSNNTKRLVDLARKRGIPVQHIETAEELNLEDLQSCEIVGLTAGTSTLDETIHQVELKLQAFKEPDTLHK
jgi:4-hydroxy-3-methylbut-2-en-1-yl diphosphate reductase